MRRVLFILAVLAVTAAYGRGAAAEGASAVEKAVPADALVLVQIKDLNSITESFDKTILADAINESEVLRSGRELLQALLRFGSVYLTGVQYEELKGLLGKNVGIVLFDTDDDRSRAPVAFIFDISHDREKFLDLLNNKVKPHLAQIAQKEIFSKEDLGGVQVEKIVLPKGPAYFLTKGDVFIIGTREAVARLAGTIQTPMSSNPAYAAVKAKVAVDAGMTVFLNVDALWQRQQEEWRVNPAERANLEVLGLLSIKALGAGTCFDGRVMQDRIFIYTGTRPTGVLGHLASQKPKPAKSAGLVPKGYSLYVTLQTGGGRNFMDMIKTTIIQVRGEQALAGWEQFRAAVMQGAAVDVETDLVGQFGNEFFLAADLKSLSGGKPNPAELPWVIGWQALDEGKISAAIGQIVYSEFFIRQGVTLDTYKYKGIDVNVLALPKNPAVQPGYAFIDGFLCFSFQTRNIEAVIDARAEGNVLTKQDDYGGLVEKLPRNPNMLVYFDAGGMARALMPVLGRKLPPNLRPLAPELRAAAQKLTGLCLAVTATEGGIAGQCYSPVGGPCFFLTALSLGELGKARDARRIAAAQKRMKTIQNAIRKYREQTGVYPTTLNELVPRPLKKMPLDPFAEGAPFRYIPARGAAPGAGQPAGAQTAAPAGARPAQPGGPMGYILFSVGPDRKLDIDPTKHSFEELRTKAESPTAADIEWVKSVVYQFKKEEFSDERDPFDEGDIVVYEVPPALKQ